MRILSIGNSFSADAHVYLHALAEQRNIDLKTENIAIGGCSLKMHWENIQNNSASYLHNINGGEEWKKEQVTVEQTLKSQAFDVITLQQVSGFSGQYESYLPYIYDIISYVRKYQPNAKLYIHRTWAYEIDSSHVDFQRYECDQDKMQSAICRATEQIAKETGMGIILAGDVIANLRTRVKKFDYKNGNESLCRDGFHLSTYARYAVAMTWLATLTGKTVEPLPFLDLDPDVISQICSIVNETVFNSK